MSNRVSRFLFFRFKPLTICWQPFWTLCKKRKLISQGLFFAQIFWQKHRQNLRCENSKEPHRLTDHNLEEKVLKNTNLTDLLVIKNCFNKTIFIEKKRFSSHLVKFQYFSLQICDLNSFLWWWCFLDFNGVGVLTKIAARKKLPNKFNLSDFFYFFFMGIPVISNTTSSLNPISTHPNAWAVSRGVHRIWFRGGGTF